MNEVIGSATKSLCPHIIATYLFTLTQKFSKFYHEHSVVNAETKEIQVARIHLIKATRQVIENCFDILGIHAIDIM